MDPITICLLIWAGVVAVDLTWETVQSWITSRKVPGGSATIIRTKLASGQYEVVTGVFNPSGAKIAERVWKASSLDATISARFPAGSNKIRIAY
jgi:hypothetical protein